MYMSKPVPAIPISHAEQKPERGADEPVAHDIEGFEVVAGMDLMPLEARVVAANDVQVEIVDADIMQVGRHLIGRCYGGREKIDAFHGFPRSVFNGGL